MRRDCAVYRSEEAEKGQTKRDAGKRKRGERTEGEAEKDLGKEIQTAERRDGDPVYGMAEPGPVPETVYPDRALPCFWAQRHFLERQSSPQGAIIPM